jgi:hypothetical protein
MSFWSKLFSNAPDTAPVMPLSAPITASGTLRCTLKIWENERIIPDPTEADIRAAVTALDDSEMGPRLRLGMNGHSDEMDLSGTPGDFGFNYHDGVVHARGYFYASKRTDYSVETAIKLLVAYRNGVPDWKTMVEWQKLKM